MMQHQYLSTRDLKFPDQRQYTKAGDMLMYNDGAATLSIYRGNTLIGTVHFSKSGLTEFLRLGWITRPVESKPPTPQLTAQAMGAPTKVKATIKTTGPAVITQEPSGEISVSTEDEIEISGSIQVDERTVASEVPAAPKRKGKKS